MKKRALLYQRKNVRNNEIEFAAFDTETEGLGGKLLSIQCGCRHERNFFSGPNMLEKFFEFLRAESADARKSVVKNYFIVLHNSMRKMIYPAPVFIRHSRIGNNLKFCAERSILKIRTKIGLG